MKATPSGEPLEIGNINELHIHRVSVSLGSGGVIPVSFGQHNDKFVHVLTEEGFRILFHELDTMPDFVHYLSDREDFFTNRCQALIYHSEGDLLMLYVQGNGHFPDYSDKTAVHLEDAGYEEFVKSDV